MRASAGFRLGLATNEPKPNMMAHVRAAAMGGQDDARFAPKERTE